MTDYICPECGHEISKHEISEFPTVGCYEGISNGFRCKCKVNAFEAYKLIIASQAQALAEAREALTELSDFEKRCKKAVSVINNKIKPLELYQHVEKNRLIGKVEGIKLAISYLKEYTKAAEWLKKRSEK